MRRLLPVLRQEELLYSAIARGRRYLMASGVGPFMRELRGRRWGIATVDLPGQLDALVRDLPGPERSVAVAGIIDKATLLPFHVAFMPPDARSRAREAMRGDIAGLHASLGLSAFRVRAPARLRFCEDCLEEMERHHGDPWWRRDHQLPGVFVCPLHGTVLRLSAVVTGDGNRHAFVPASRAVCGPDAPMAVIGVADADLRRLGDLALGAAALLASPPLAREYDEILADYRSRLADVGLMRSRLKVDHVALHRAFRGHWGGVPDLIEGLGFVDDPTRSWLSALVRNGRRAAHPLQHLMLTTLLNEMPGDRADRPFGSGPWECRNPLADHHRESVVSEVQLRRDRGTVYGDFACSCGYVYTCSMSPGGVAGQPRYRRFGPLLAPALRAAVKKRRGLRETARTFGLDPKTLIREAQIAGVKVPWSTAASGAIPLATEAKATKLGSECRPRPLPRRRLRNWFAIDARLSASVRANTAAIRAESPPLRVTFAELERRLARRDWVRKRRDKLPRTIDAMRGELESTIEFRSRRLEWCVRMSFEEGDPRPCDIMRAAGLPTGWLPAVRYAIADARLSVSLAA